MPESSETPAPICRRCGQCCQSGGPALHLADLPLVRSGTISRAHLFTLRPGETVNENVTGRLIVLEREMVKIAGREQSQACLFHDARRHACRIHVSRPVECRALFCEDTSAVQALYRRDRLTRADIISTGGGLWELTRFHDRAFPAGAAAHLARQAATGHTAARERLAEMARAEGAFRRTFQEKTGVPRKELDFYFGRSIARICAQFGVRLTP